MNLQECYIDIDVGPADENYVRLIPEVSDLEWETKELTQFTIIDTALGSVNETSVSLKKDDKAQEEDYK